MISRREFLVGIGAGLILPKFFDRALAAYDNFGEAILEAPQVPNPSILTARTYGDGYQLLLGDPDEQPPESMTLREYVERYGYWDMETAEENWDMALDDQMDFWQYFDTWCREDSPNARAYHLLDSYDLGSLRGHGREKAGEIEFIDGPCPGNDYLGVEAATALDLSLLQTRLNELGAGVQLVVG
ncbi:MAG: hypothetical protein ACX93N_08135 [Pseudohaliea sp.]